MPSLFRVFHCFSYLYYISVCRNCQVAFREFCIYFAVPFLSFGNFRRLTGTIRRAYIPRGWVLLNAAICAARSVWNATSILYRHFLMNEPWMVIRYQFNWVQMKAAHFWAGSTYQTFLPNSYIPFLSYSVSPYSNQGHNAPHSLTVTPRTPHSMSNYLPTTNAAVRRFWGLTEGMRQFTANVASTDGREYACKERASAQLIPFFSYGHSKGVAQNYPLYCLLVSHKAAQTYGFVILIQL